MRKLLALLMIAAAATALTWLAVDQSMRGNSENVADAARRYSNIHPEDYVGPETCAKCHAEYFETWRGHAHSKMNLNATDETVLGDFAAKAIEYGDGRVVFDQRDGQFLMSFYENDQLSRQYRVTRTVGSRFTQMYIGLQTVGPEPENDQVYRIEGKLPFGYWLERQLWTPVSYFDSAYDPEPTDGAAKFHELSASQRDIKWELNCLYCHNTYAYQHRVHFGHGMGFHPEDFRFPEGEQSVARWGALTPDKLVTLGISCESCHFGGREHVETGAKTRYYPSSPQLTVTGLAEKPHDGAPPAHVVNAICSQCHCANVTLYPNGAATWNSREAFDLQSGACNNLIKCTDCHNPHVAGPQGGLASEANMVQTCVRCHPTLEDPAERAKHTRHAAESVTCLDCHMPRIVQGLDSVVRTHQISSPTQESMLRHAGPNACNLCHLDRSIQWTLDELQKGWGVSIRPDRNWAAEYGANLDQPVGQAWLHHQQPVGRLIASDAFARSTQELHEAPELLDLLNDPNAVNRMFGLFAIEQILGRRLTDEEYAPLAPHAKRNKQVETLREQLTKPHKAE
jgi:predicted CXXCH cytochrome family protein